MRTGRLAVRVPRESRIKANLAALQKADQVSKDAFSGVQSMMADMVGGGDEYAAVFKAIGPA